MIQKFSDTTLSEHAISGVVFKELKTFPDDRGFFREVIRHNDPFFEGSGDDERCFAQWSHSKMAQNTVKAWHFHHRQIDWWYVPIGLVHVVLFDHREESSTCGKKIEFLLGDSSADPRVLTSVVKIPQGVLHGCKVLSDTAHLFYVTSRTYDPQDEGRYPFDSKIVPHVWGDPAELIVAANDRREHIPSYERVRAHS
ncbi:MAG: dTDP-4-dehydrorhamnose 3,5-epimerase family protein [Bdellovibrionota bacterium]